jgi:hypothetical protein
MLRIGFPQALLEARFYHRGQAAKSAMPLPIGYEPLQIQGPTGQEPEIRCLDGFNKRIGIPDAVSGREGANARVV